MADEFRTPPLGREFIEEHLRALRAAEGARPSPISLAGAWLVEADLRGLDLGGYDLRGADLSRADLRGAGLARACLDEATLFETRLENAELIGASLRGARLERCNAQKVGFGRCDLRGASLFDADLSGAVLTGADLTGVDARAVKLDGARIRDAKLVGADLTGAVLTRVDLGSTRLDRAVLRDADLRGAQLRDVGGYASADWVGVDFRDVCFNGAYLLRRFALDQNFLAEFRAESPMHEALYRLWWVTSDCGRSFVRWGLWTLCLAAVFAGLYSVLELDAGAHETVLTPLYFSVVTLTTLGYGDVLPASGWAQCVAMVEVILGYVMLGGLLSIFANKMARRAD
ncbi:MAG: pentapeptide repeat-containing protein [Pseudomonadota bacterium]